MSKTGRQPKPAVGMILFCLALSTFGEAAEQGWRTLDGESRDPGQAERLIRDLMGPYAVNALAAAVVQDDRIIFIYHAGHIDENRLVKVGDQSVFRAASMGKPVFAYLVARLADEGLFDLDRPIERILGKPLYSFPGYRDLAGDERQKLLTPRLLLSHQSGFPNWRRMTEDRLVFLSGPGDRFGYSGEGYRLLQFVLETITGEKLDPLARQKVFLPLGMEQSSFLWQTRFDGRFAVRLDTGLRPLIERTKTEANVAGSFVTRVEDYARFLIAAMNGRGLKPETARTMLSPHVRIQSDEIGRPPAAEPGPYRNIELSWTLGWGRFVSPAGEAFFHIGQEDGCENYAVYFPGRRTGLVLLTACGEKIGIAAEVSRALIGDRYSPFSWMGY